jgi:hypothetical protein
VLLSEVDTSELVVAKCECFRLIDIYGLLTLSTGLTVMSNEYLMISRPY